MNEKRSFFKLVFFVFSVLIAITQLTDADLTDQETIRENTFQTTTLDFANQDTANNTLKSLLFNISGLVPGGFQVETVRIRQKGKLGFEYELKSESLTGDTVLCQELSVMVLTNWQIQYDGKLTDLSYQANLDETENYEDLVLVLKLNSNSSNLFGKTCGFNLKITTTDEADSSAFSDEEVLTNQITTASSWKS